MAGMITVPYGHTVVQRPAPLMPAQSYKTYGMSMPLQSHWRRATCDEVLCEPYRNGFASTFDLSTDLGQRQFAFCKADKDRSYTLQRVSQTVVKLVYKPGTPCFNRQSHRVQMGRPPVLYVAEGDFRGNPRRIPARVHQSGENWVEDFSGHVDKLATEIQKG